MFGKLSVKGASLAVLVKGATAHAWSLIFGKGVEVNITFCIMSLYCLLIISLIVNCMLSLSLLLYLLSLVGFITMIQIYNKSSF